MNRKQLFSIILIAFINLLEFAKSLWMLFASHIVDGVMRGNLSVAEAYISAVTDAKNCRRNLRMPTPGQFRFNLVSYGTGPAETGG